MRPVRTVLDHSARFGRRAMAEKGQVDVDGSSLEGGGQVLRCIAALGVATKRPVKVTNIRGKRSPPGLRPQHATSLKLVASISDGRLEGCDINSSEVTFVPGPYTSLRDFAADAGTAGATTLMVQAALPALIMLDGLSTLRLKGGTNVAYSPSIDHLELVLAPNLALFGVDLQVHCERRGFYPEGGGRVKVTVQRMPSSEPPDLSSNHAEPVRLVGVVCGRGGTRERADRVASLVSKRARRAFGLEPVVNVDDACTWDAAEAAPTKKQRRKNKRAALAVQLALTTSSGATVGADVLVEDVKPDHDLDDIAGKLVATLEHRLRSAGGGVDVQTLDQLILVLALGDRSARLRCPVPKCQHLETVMHYATQFIPRASFTTTVDDVSASLVVDCVGGAVVPCDGEVG